MINFSQASENNKGPILEQLKVLFAEPGTVLEVGSGAGQHALHFCAALPHLTWQPTDQGAYFDGLVENLATVASGTLAPIYLDVSQDWPEGGYHYGFSANVLHIAAATLTEPFFAGFGRSLEPGGRLCVYGPFRYNGSFTTESNERFDAWLKGNDARSGIRDIETVTSIAAAHGLDLVQDIAMPANNQLLVFDRNPP